MARYSLPTAKFGFDGSISLAQWSGAALSQVFQFATATIAFNKSSNIYRPPTSDANGNMHLENAGLRIGTLEIAAPLLVDRGAVPFILLATQQATRGLPFQMSLLPFGSGVVQNAGNIFIRQIRLNGQTAVDGRTSMVMLQITAWVLDPDNAQGLTALALPASAGTSGAGITSFMRSSLTDQASTPNDYRMTEFSWMHDNAMTVSPTRVPGTIYSEGGIPGQRSGSLSVSQDKNAVNVLQASTGHYDFTLNMPSGDLPHSATGTVHTSYDDENLNVSPDALVRGGRNFALFQPNPLGDLTDWLYS